MNKSDNKLHFFCMCVYKCCVIRLGKNNCLIPIPQPTIAQLMPIRQLNIFLSAS